MSPQNRCADHQRMLQDLSDSRIKGLILEKDIAELVHQMRQIADRQEQILKTFETEMGQTMENIKSILDDFREEITIATDPRSQESN